MSNVGRITRHSTLGKNIDSVWRIEYSGKEYRGYVDEQGFVFNGMIDESEKQCIGKVDNTNGTVYYLSKPDKDSLSTDKDEIGFVAKDDGHIWLVRGYPSGEGKIIGFVVPTSYTGEIGEIHTGWRGDNPKYKFNAAHNKDLREKEERLFVAGGAALLLFSVTHPLVLLSNK